MYYARWATDEETKRRLIPVGKGKEIEKSGIPLMFDDDNLYIDGNETHNLIIGASGSGKTQASILPLLKLSMLAGDSIVLNDPRGENYSRCSDMLKNEKYKVLCVDFDDARYGNSWNPLELPYRLYKDGQIDKSNEMIEKVGYYLFYSKSDLNSDPFWVNSCIDFFTGLVLYLFDKAKAEEINLNSVAFLSDYLNTKGRANEFLEKIDPKSNIYINLCGTLTAPPETRGSIISVFNQKMKVYVSKEKLSSMLSNGDFSLDDITNKKCALFIIGGANDYSDSLIPLLVDQIVECSSIYSKKERYLNILLDEFDSLVPIKNFMKMLDYARGLKIRFSVVIKSYKHLFNIYSKDDAELLKLCFGNIIYLLSNDIYTLEEISAYCGNQLVNGKVVPLITVEELKTMDVFEAIVIMCRMMPIKTKLLPNYKIDWGFQEGETKPIERLDKKIEIFEMK